MKRAKGKFTGLIEIQRLFREQGFPYLYNQRSNIVKIIYIARRCLSTARSTSSNRALLLVCRIPAKVHLYRADKVLHSVCLSVRTYDLFKIGMPKKLQIYWALNARHV